MFFSFFATFRISLFIILKVEVWVRVARGGEGCESERGLRCIFLGVCYRTALPMEGAHARTRNTWNTRNYLSLSHFLKWRIHSRVVSLALFRKCRLESFAITTGKYLIFLWFQFHIQHFAIVVFVFCFSALHFLQFYCFSCAISFCFLPKFQCGKFSFVVFAVFQQQQLVSLCTCRMFCELKPSETQQQHQHSRKGRTEHEHEHERRAREILSERESENELALLRVALATSGECGIIHATNSQLLVALAYLTMCVPLASPLCPLSHQLLRLCPRGLHINNARIYCILCSAARNAAASKP